MDADPPCVLELRDRLALERTHLANERTLLAYVRTGLALGAAGAALLHFFPDRWLTVAAAWLLVGAAALTLGVGVWRFISVRAALRGSDDAPRGR